MPHQANVAGNIHGGEIIKLMDSTAYATARRYARTNVVTARVDEAEGKKRALTAFFTMIALDKKGRPTKVPELTLETEEEKRAFEEGRLRYERHKHKK